jgi:hypothetical protein
MCATHLRPSVCVSAVAIKVINASVVLVIASNNKQDILVSREGKFWCRYFLASRRHSFQFVQVHKHLRYDWSACLISRHMWMTHHLFNRSV